jgi:hypothetical protein
LIIDGILGELSIKVLILDDEDILLVGLKVIVNLCLDLSVHELSPSSRDYYLHDYLLLAAWLQQVSVK